MKILKKIGYSIIAIILIVVIIGIVYANNQKPKLEGELSLSITMNDTEVYFDDYGVPHIYADNQEDAYATFGYIHAQDRLWQMELVRRIAPGRLSEVFGKDMLKTDKFFNGMGISEASAKALELADKTSPEYIYALAYLKGINKFIAKGSTPIEYSIVGLDKTEFTMLDIYNTFGYMAFSFAMAHKTDPLITHIQSKLGSQYISDLDLNPKPNTLFIQNNHPEEDDHYANISAEVSKLLEGSPIPAFIGSNSWVLAPEKTKNGKVLFANDPHIAYSQPTVWYEAHIKTPNYEIYGYHLAGVPFALLGHNRDYAYGVTMFENDDMDFFLEENNPDNPNQYKYKGEYLDYEITEKTIKIKGEEPVVQTIKTSRHGPIMNGLISDYSDEKPLAMWWMYTQFPVKSLKAIYGLSHAKNMADAQDAVALIHAPGLNIMYGDSKGNIAWWASAKLYEYAEGVDTKQVLDGSSGEQEPIRFLDFKENPMSVNPKSNYVYSANNQPDSISVGLYPGYYLPEDRAKRIVQQLEKKDKWDTKDMQNLIVDDTSPVVTEVISILNSVVDKQTLSAEDKQALEILNNWDGNYQTTSIAATIYTKWIYNYLKNTFKDELGQEVFDQFIKTYVLKRTIAQLVENKNSVWWDDVNTTGKETRTTVFTKSLSETVKELSVQLGDNMQDWTWSRVQTLEHNHPFGKKAALRSFFNVGPTSIDGGREVIDNRGYNLNSEGIYKVTSGPSTRRIIDFSDVENSVSILPTGQSGNVFSKHYSDQAEMYNKGEFRKMKMNRDEIERVSTKLIFKASK